MLCPSASNFRLPYEFDHVPRLHIITMSAHSFLIRILKVAIVAGIKFWQPHLQQIYQEVGTCAEVTDSKIIIDREY